MHPVSFWKTGPGVSHDSQRGGEIYHQQLQMHALLRAVVLKQTDSNLFKRCSTADVQVWVALKSAS